MTFLSCFVQINVSSTHMVFVAVQKKNNITGPLYNIFVPSINIGTFVHTTDLGVAELVYIIVYYLF